MKLLIDWLWASNKCIFIIFVFSSLMIVRVFMSPWLFVITMMSSPNNVTFRIEPVFIQLSILNIYRIVVYRSINIHRNSTAGRQIKAIHNVW